MSNGVTSGFRELLGRLVTYKVDWDTKLPEGYQPGDDREEEGLDDARVVSSRLKPCEDTAVNLAKEIPDVFSDDPFAHEVKHVVALDIDYPAHLIESSTPGHYHLYLDVPGGIPHSKYLALLQALANAGVIEQGYAEVSIARGHSDLRLPWVSKDDGDSKKEPRTWEDLT